ncbi:PREDICTED: synapse differentiation-inducing gene protein 1-like [Amphimedon queenslandica]|nr:PREDICTED: synapse differentiation-inducing gene protein 1-like [Amphimedon queenslandica]|eukprot:XP_019853762.1 PREDICTED: synapse differentiation-inducing gene protein 1-like [Amphimedon queenslandica]
MSSTQETKGDQQVLLHQNDSGLYYSQQKTINNVGYMIPPSSYFWLSIFSMTFCFMPVAVMALIKSVEARTHLKHGYFEEARSASRKAKIFNLISIVIGLTIHGISVIFIVIYFTVIGKHN